MNPTAIERTRAATMALLLAPALGLGAAHAGPVYDPGALNFSFRNQSIWGTGSGIAPATISASTRWNSSATLGGITGGAREIITPEVPSVLITPAVPAVQVTPAIPATYVSYWEPRVDFWVSTATWDPATWGNGYWSSSGCGCTITTSTVLTPAVPAVYSPAVPAVYSPYVPPVYGDTRTGVASTLGSSGRVGVSGNFGLNGGTLDADLRFKSNFVVPDTVNAKEFFRLGGSQSFEAGTMSGAFPKLTGVISADFAINNSATNQICAFGLGCATDGGTVTDIDTGSFKLIELNTAKVPDKLSLMGLDAAAFDITRMRVFADYQAPKVQISLPGQPRLQGASISLGVLDLDYPDLNSAGGRSGGSLVASGRFDNVIRLDADLDGIFGAVMAGGRFAGGVVFDKKPFTYRLDGVDIKLGPTLDMAQDLTLTPSLMVDLDFSQAVRMRSPDGVVSEIIHWSGQLDSLPEFALLNEGDRVRVNPSYWIRAAVSNQMDLEFDATLGLDVLKGEVLMGPVSSPEWCLVCQDLAMPLGHAPLPASRFSIDSDRVRAASFQLTASDASGAVPGAGPGAVPEPASLALVATAMTLLLSLRRRAPQ